MSRADYMRRKRAADPDFAARERLRNMARSRALTRLAALHPDDYETLLNEERLALNVPPKGVLPVGRPASRSTAA